MVFSNWGVKQCPMQDFLNTFMTKFDISNAVHNDRSPRLASTSTLCRIFLTHFWPSLTVVWQPIPFAGFFNTLMSKCDTSNAVLNDRSPRLQSTSTLCRIFFTHFWHIKCCSQWQVAKSGINQMKFWAFASLTALHAEWNKKMKCMQTCQIGEGTELLFDWSAKCQFLLLILFAHFCNFFGFSEITCPLVLDLTWI